MLSRAGDSLKGRNLRKSSWRQIAEVATSSVRLQTIVWDRLFAASTRDDALRVLRIVRFLPQPSSRIVHTSIGRPLSLKLP